MTSFPDYWPAFNRNGYTEESNAVEKKSTSTLRWSAESTKGGKSPQKQLSESVRIRKWPWWLGTHSWTFPSTRLEAEWCWQQEKGWNWKGDYVQNYWERIMWFQWIFLTAAPWIQICFFYTVSQNHTDFFFPNSSLQFLTTSSKASYHYSYPMAELLKSFWIKSVLWRMSYVKTTYTLH